MISIVIVFFNYILIQIHGAADYIHPMEGKRLPCTDICSNEQNQSLFAKSIRQIRLSAWKKDVKMLASFFLIEINVLTPIAETTSHF